MSRRCVVTGATGLLGSHLVELLVEHGQAVRALVRPGSDTHFLARLGVDLVVGDLTQPGSLLDAVDGADLVFHCAGRVGDGGPWSLHFRDGPVATVNLLKASEIAAVGRFLHVSSVTVYGHPPRLEGHSISEDAPLGQNPWWWDHASRATILAEQRVQVYPGDWTIVRPTWIYGPRDRHRLPWLIPALRAGRVAILGTGTNPVDLIHAEDVAEGAYRAATNADAVGQTFHLAGGPLSQHELLDAMTDELGLPRITRRASFTLALWTAFVCEAWSRFRKIEKPREWSRQVVAALGGSIHYSSDRARTQLGWSPRVEIREGLRRTFAWYLQQQAERAEP